MYALEKTAYKQEDVNTIRLKIEQRVFGARAGH